MGCVRKNFLMLMLVMVLLFVYGEHWAEAQVNHVVGEDRGWELASDIGSWVEGRTFIVGDFLCMVFFALLKALFFFTNFLEVPMFTASGLRVRFLKVWEKSGYNTVEWVRYITKAGSYEVRC